MSQNPEQADQGEPTAVSQTAPPEGLLPPVREPPEGARASRRGLSRSSVITSDLEGFRPGSGPGGTTPDGGETKVVAPVPPVVRPKRRSATAPSTARRRGRRPRQPRPSFRGPRLADFIGWWRRLRSIVFLVVITVILGMILAAIVAVAIGAVVVSIQHALKSSG